ncbi:MAG: hypothetical protein O3B95_00330 [Chloroflexi bacterium]|nr:hypothetical protein [Chloroflexota bacterium]
MRYQVWLSTRTKVLVFVFMAMFVLSACEDGDVFQVTRLTATPDPNVTATSIANPSDTPAPDSTVDPSAIATPTADLSTSTVPPGTTATPASDPESAATPNPVTTPGAPTATASPPSVPPTPAPASTPIAPPIASFTLDTVSGQAPLEVELANTSSGQINDITWEIGDLTSTDYSPIPRSPKLAVTR